VLVYGDGMTEAAAVPPWRRGEVIEKQTTEKKRSKGGNGKELSV